MFIVTPEEFAEAKTYFALYPHLNFKKRKAPASPHSFIKLEMDDLSAPSIFAIANKHEGVPLLGTGGSAKVKRVKNEHGEEFALKIEGGHNLSKRDASDPSLIIMRQMGVFKGQTSRIYDKSKTYIKLKKEINSKRYTLLELIEGENLHSLLIKSRQDERLLCSLQKRLIALSLAINLYSLHHYNFAHADVTAANFVVTRIDDHDIETQIIDFDYALILSSLGYATWSSARGTSHYIAPEVLAFNRYSKCSDIYGLGYIFYILDIQNLCGHMRSIVPSKRPLVEQVILELVHDIKFHFRPLDSNTKRAIERALHAISPYTLSKFKEYLSLSEIFNLKLIYCLNASQRAIIALRCCQAALACSQQEKHFNLSVNNLIVYLDEKSIDVYLNCEYSSEEFDEFSLVYALGEIVEALGFQSGNMKAGTLERLRLTETIPFLIEQVPLSSEDSLPMRILEEIRKSAQDYTTKHALTVSASSLTSSGGDSSSFSLNLEHALNDLIQKVAELELTTSSLTFSALPSTTSPHAVSSELHEFEKLELVASSSFTVGMRVAAAAASVTGEDALERASSFTPQAKRFPL